MTIHLCTNLAVFKKQVEGNTSFELQDGCYASTRAHMMMLANDR